MSGNKLTTFDSSSRANAARRAQNHPACAKPQSTPLSTRLLDMPEQESQNKNLRPEQPVPPIVVANCGCREMQGPPFSKVTPLTIPRGHRTNRFEKKSALKGHGFSRAAQPPLDGGLQPLRGRQFITRSLPVGLLQFDQLTVKLTVAVCVTCCASVPAPVIVTV
jgi:hypothetical protein